jgi:deoxyribodipyrimidine photo-lyase
MKFKKGLFVFRRDFRIADNRGLYHANDICETVIPVFIFTPEQVGKSNSFKSNNAIQFMIESLADLQQQIHKQNGNLLCLYGENTHVLADLIKSLSIDYVCCNKDYSPYAVERHHKIAELCKKLDVVCDSVEDYYLHEPGSVLSGSKEPYQKFTPFYNACRSKQREAPLGLRKIKFTGTTYSKNKVSLDHAMSTFTKKNPDILVKGGRSQAILALTRAKKNVKQYTATHNSLEKTTTELSAYIKFGCLSIREVQQAFKNNTNLVRQLIWRDFFANILYFFPHVLGKAMRPNYNKITWHHSPTLFHAWKTGTTGFPVVDAGMRQLNTTGYMHNRARLIVASFFVKTLLLDWRQGEKYFANQLTDYDPASNNGNWQWIMGGGADSQPYFRIFNPWQQSENYDPHAVYIKTWIPELKDVPEKDIHHWDTEYTQYKQIHYPKPIVDYAKQKQIALKMYRDVFH